MYVIKRDQGQTGADVPRSLTATSGSASVAASFDFNAGNDVTWEIVHKSSTLGPCVVEQLLPNTRYQFRVRHMSNRSSSTLSPPLVVYTPPLRPHAPAIIDIQPRGCRIRWATAQCGAFKYRVEVALIDNLTHSGGMGAAPALPPPTPTPGAAGARPGTARSRAASVGRRSVGPGSVARGGGGGRPATASIAVDEVDANGKPLEWKAAWEGKPTMAFISNLVPLCVYRLRVVALNAEGGASVPSMPIGFTTANPDTYRPLTRTTVLSQFNLPVGVDEVCVGDTLLWTECVWLDGDTMSTEVAPSHNTGTSPRVLAAAVAAERLDKTRQSTARPRTAAGGVGVKAAAGGGGSSSTASQPAGAALLKPPVLVASRTVAAVVLDLPHSGRGAIDVSASYRSGLSGALSGTFSVRGAGGVPSSPKFVLETVWSFVTVIEEWKPRGAHRWIKPEVESAMSYVCGKRFLRGVAALSTMPLMRCPWHEESLRSNFATAQSGLAEGSALPSPTDAGVIGASSTRVKRLNL